MKNSRIYDLEDRFINYAVSTSELAEKLPNTRLGNYLANQLIKSGTSPALNYGEAQGAESKKDFIHKLRIILKELRETKICIRIISRKQLVNEMNFQDNMLKESGELIAIILTSIKTTRLSM